MRSDVADESALFDAVLAVDAVWPAAVDALFFTFERSPFAAEVAAAVAADFAAVLEREDRSRFDNEDNVLSTFVWLLLFTRFFDPEMSPLRNDPVFLAAASPLILFARVMRFAILVGFVISSFPSALYCVNRERSALPALFPLLAVRAGTVLCCDVESWAAASWQGLKMNSAETTAAMILKDFIFQNNK